MTNPIGYHATSDAAQLLEQRYGSYLEQLSKEQKLLLAMVQCYAVLTECSWSQAMVEISNVLLDLDENDAAIFTLLEGCNGEDDIGIANAAIELYRFGPGRQPSAA